MPISIHGKDYVLVNERIKEFHKLYPNGSIQTEMNFPDQETVRCQAVIKPDCNSARVFCGHAEENRKSSQINRTSAVENCETSAVGRALAMLGIGIETAIASAEEVVGALNQEPFADNAKIEDLEPLTVVQDKQCIDCGRDIKGPWKRCYTCNQKAKEVTN